MRPLSPTFIGVSRRIKWPLRPRLAGRWLAILTGLTLSTTGCGEPTRVTPTSPTSSATSGPITGTWTGNIQSSNFDTTPVTVQVAQSGTAVVGTWTAAAGWLGTISGVISTSTSGAVSTSTFTGTFTISLPNPAGAPRCTGAATVIGAVGGTTMTWTSPGFSGSCPGEPTTLTFNLSIVPPFAAPSMSVLPTSLTFDTQSVSTTSPSQIVLLATNGNVTQTPVSIIGISIAGDYAQTNNCGTTLAVGASCSIVVTFTPTATGSRTGSLGITATASNSPLTVTLTGTGL